MDTGHILSTPNEELLVDREEGEVGGKEADGAGKESVIEEEEEDSEGFVTASEGEDDESSASCKSKQSPSSKEKLERSKMEDAVGEEGVVKNESSGELVFTSSMNRDTEEYRKILKRYDTIIDQLSSARCSGVLADKLRSKELITGPTYEEALIVGPGVVESTRIRPMIAAVLAKVELNTANYYRFVIALQEISGVEDIVQQIQAPLPLPESEHTDFPKGWHPTGTSKKTEVILKSLSLPHMSQPPECVAIYCKYLKERYSLMSVLPDGDWPPSIGGVYTELTLIDKVKRLPTTEETEKMEDHSIHGEINELIKEKGEHLIKTSGLFSSESHTDRPKKVLMDGAPGAGKTTITRKMCQNWASGELLHQYHLVILLELRNRKIYQAESIGDLLPADDPELRQQVTQHIQKTSGKHVLLIFDGYDELNYKEKSTSLFLDIIKGEILHNCSVLVTSRPYASDYLQSLNCISRHVEVIGFTQQQIQNCILQNIPNQADAEHLILLLEEDFNIMSLCYTPLHCAIMLYVYRQEKHTLPNSVTKLFALFILNALKRHTRKLNEHKSLRTLDELPDPMRSQFEALCNLAHDSFLDNKLVYCDKDLKSIMNFSHSASDSDLNLNTFSLMTAFKSFTSAGEDISYQFLHLNIQEFLAARWMATKVSAEKQAAFIKQSMSCTRYKTMLAFLAGISQLKSPISNELFPEKSYGRNVRSLSIPTYVPGHTSSSWPLVENYYKGNKAIRIFLLLAYMIFESQNFKLFTKLLSILRFMNEKELSFHFYRLAPADCLALAHFLSNVERTWEVLGFNFCGLTDHSLEIFKKVPPKQHSGRFKTVKLCYNASTLIMKLSLIPKIAFFKNITTLNIAGLEYPNGLPAKQIELSKVLDIKSLTHLRISFQHVSKHHSTDYLSIFSRFTAALKTNKTLRWLSYEHPPNSDCSVFAHTAEILGKNNSLHLYLGSTLKIQMGYSCGLSQMKPKLCATVAFHLFQLPCMEHVKRLLFQHKTPFNTCDTCTVTRESAMQAFRVFTKTNSNISKVNISHCDEDAEYIVAGLAENRSLQAIDSSKVQLSGRTVENLLRATTCITELFLSHCGLNSEDAERIATGLAGNTSLERLSVSENEMSAEGIALILGSQTPTSNLKYFDISNQIGNLENIMCGAETLSHIVSGFITLYSNTTVILTIPEVGIVKIFNTGIQTIRLQLQEPGETTGEGCMHLFKALNQGASVKVNLPLITFNHSIAETKLFEKNFTKLLAYRDRNISTSYAVNSLTSHTAVSMFSSLECNTSLEELDLSGNYEIGETTDHNEEVGCALERMLSVNTGIQTLNLQWCEITGKKIGVGMAGNKSLRVLNISWNNILSGGAVSIFTSLQHNTSLVELDLSCNIQLTEGDSEAVGCAFERMLTVNRGIRSLKLQRCGLNDDIGNKIGVGLTGNRSLKVLNIRQNSIHSEGAVSIFTSLQHNTSLEELDLSQNEQLTEGDSEAVGCALERMLMVNRGIHTLKLGCCGVSDDIGKMIGIGLAGNKSLIVLDISSNEIGSGGAVSILASLQCNTTLKELDLSLNKFVDSDSEEVGCAFEQMLTVNTALQTLKLRGVDNNTGKMIGIGLGSNKSLRVLDVTWGTIQSDGAVVIFTSLEHNTSLEELNLASNLQLAEGDSKAVGSALKRMLTVNRKIQTLKIEHCGLHDKTGNMIGVIGVGLAGNSTLRVLDIACGNIHSGGAVDIFTSLAQNTSLEVLDLSSNWKLATRNGKSVDCALRRMLTENTTLKALNLHECFSGLFLKDYLIDIANGLAHNASLVELNISNNHSIRWVQLFKVLCRNSSLKKLDISKTNVGQAHEVEALAEMLAYNKSLTELIMQECHNMYTKTKLRVLAKGLLQNTTLQKLVVSDEKTKEFLETENKRLQRTEGYGIMSNLLILSIRESCLFHVQ